MGLDVVALLQECSADSLYLFERLIEEFDSDSFDADELGKERLSKWINTVSATCSRQAWLRYVMAEGLNEAQAAKLLCALRPTINTLPDWANLLGEVLRCGTVSGTSTDAERPPFDELWEPFRTTFRQHMTARFPKESSTLALAALYDLERSLSAELSSMALTTIFARFSAYRSARLGPFAAMASPSSDEVYRAYIRHEFADGLGSLFGRYPVLARRLADRTLRWIEAHIEMLERLAADRLLISRQFAQGCAPGRLESVVPAVSDFHASGRSAAVLCFSSGVRIVYKPRSMGLEGEFNAFLSKLNEQGAPLDFRVVKILDRGAYGWAEFVQHEPVPDDAAAGRYYGRIGALLAVLYLLHGTDYHMGNLIASGEYPVAIDHECLLSPGEQLLLERGPSEAQRENDDSRHSVRSVGILPYPKELLHARTDRSALGAYDSLILSERRMRCNHVNTDAMSLSVAPHASQPDQNVLMVGNRPAYPRSHLTSISQGFVNTYRFLMERRDGLDASDELFRGFAGQLARLIVRPSQAYADLLERITGPENHGNGVDFGLALERLARTYVDNPIVPGSWPLLAAERAALIRDDIPVFRFSTSERWVEGDGGLHATGVLRRRSYDEVVNRWLELSDYDLEWQRGLIEHAFSSGERLLVNFAEPAVRESAVLPPAHADLLAEAGLIAKNVAGQAWPQQDGSVIWVGPGFDAVSGRVGIRPLSGDLYVGSSGIALFLAAVAACGAWRDAGPLTLAALKPLRAALADRASVLDLAREGIGAGTGLMSQIYTLAVVGEILNDSRLIDEADAAVSLLPTAQLEADFRMDLIHGTAGAIATLLRIYELTNNSDVLKKAMSCGRFLLSRSRQDNQGNRAWDTTGSNRLSLGFGHGAAGIAYALLRLYGACGRDDFLQAASEAIAFEDAAYDPKQGRWPFYVANDERLEPVDKSHLAGSWCNGTSGIGLGRAAGLDWLETPQIRDDIERSMDATIKLLQTDDSDEDDHLCCGSFGRIECLLWVGHRTRHAEWVTEAARQLTRRLSKARIAGKFRLSGSLDGVWPPLGFHKGLSGIGYQLLRLADPQRFPSVLIWE